MHKKKVYPPRLEMTVQILNSEAQHVKLSVSLEGCKEQPTFQIFLPFGNAHSKCIMHIHMCYNVIVSITVTTESNSRSSGLRWSSEVMLDLKSPSCIECEIIDKQ